MRRRRSGAAARHASPSGQRGPVLKRVVLICIAAALFLLVSGLLAGFLSTENAERSQDLALIEAETRGDLAGMLSRLSGCAARPACLGSARANARDPRTRRAGAVKILQLTSATAYSLGRATGPTRLAWTVIGQQPVVQCIQVRRSGNPLQGITVTLLSLSSPIANEADC